MGEIENILSLSNSLSEFVVGAEGNISCRIGDDILITASGTKFSTLTPDDIVRCDLGGNQVGKTNLKPSIESSFHSYLLSLDGVSYVAHTHPTNTMKLLCSDAIYGFARLRIFPDQVVFNGGISCIVPYAHPGDDLVSEIKRSVDRYVLDQGNIPSLILLQNHGIICVGKSPQECVTATQICEKSAEIYNGARVHGIKTLSVEDVERIENDINEKYRQKINEGNIR